ncbi:MAG: diguanylate cyclase [Magnetococcales bacterium]|nr:diguanylate cyclase [Magnetococcales bacterium]
MNEIFQNFTVQDANDLIEQMELALIYHDEWLGVLNRSLVCNLEFPEDITTANSHSRCKFGVWLQSSLKHSIGDSSVFNDLELIHKLMHDTVRELALTPHDKISVDKYDEFLFRRQAFRWTCDSLMHQACHSILHTDPLTRTFNRHSLIPTLQREQARIADTGETSVLVLADIDHFKKINDTYGHMVGDKVLVSIANILTTSSRPMDIIFRYGGEEFLLYLPGTTMSAAKVALERIRKKIEGHRTKTKFSQSIQVTMSFGASILDKSQEIQESINQADRALYQAKQSGRNRFACIE